MKEILRGILIHFLALLIILLKMVWEIVTEVSQLNYTDSNDNFRTKTNWAPAKKIPSLHVNPTSFNIPSSDI